MKLSFYILLGVALSAIVAIAVGPGLGFASSNSQVTANVNVGNVIYISITPTSNSIGNVYPASSYNTLVLFTDIDNGGNLAANVFISGGNWYYGSNTFGVSNTVWSATYNVAGTSLSNTLANTNIVIPQPTIGAPSQSNVIYLGVHIPAGAPAGLWEQNVTFENENLSSSGSIIANSVTENAIFEANVQSACYISLSSNSISFGSVAASANVPTNKLITDTDNGGNVAANILVEGTNWALSSNTQITFGVTNTLWSPSLQSTYAGTALTSTLTNTGIVIAAPTLSTGSASNSIYFGLAVPPGTPAGTYSQTITIENSC